MSLQIAIHYRSKQGREVPLSEIINGSDNMDFEDYEPKNFWNVMGGFEIVIDGYNTIFCSSNFYVLVNATSFLIHSMYWIKGKESDWFDKDDAFPNDVIVRLTNNDIVSLQHKNENEMLFSYSQADKGKRINKSVKNKILNKNEWLNQATLALTEYFEILTQANKKHPEQEVNKMMLEYHAIWSSIQN